MIGVGFLCFLILMRCLFQKWIFIEGFLIILGAMILWNFLQLRRAGFFLERVIVSFDWLSVILIILSFFIRILIVSARYSRVKFLNKRIRNFLFLIILMLFSLFLSFIRSKVIIFYVFFEMSLIPIFLIIMGWGNQPERLQAGLYMLFYTLFGSLPLLAVVLMNIDIFEYFFLISTLKSNSIFSFLMMFFFIFAFLVKLPIFGVHLWLPKAHVEAPVAGSMILAGVLLKLGGYGLWRVRKLLERRILARGWLWVIMGLVGGTLVSFICMIQVDMKSLVAYSSVVHIGLGLGGLAVLRIRGYEGIYCIILGHGLVSSLMFFLVGVMYDRMHSRRLMLRKGLIVLFPFFTLFWFIACIYNIRAPPSISLLGEIYLTLRLLQWNVFCFFWLILINFIGIVFTFYLYTQRQQGKSIKRINILWSINPREIMISIFHSFSVTRLVVYFWLF